MRSYNWIETSKMIADILTKETASKEFEEIASINIYRGLATLRNRAIFNGVEIKKITNYK